MRGAAMVALAVLAGCARQEAPAASDAWVRLAAVPGRPAAGYLTLHGGDRPATLVAIAAAGVPRVELHQSRMGAGGMMTMDATPSVAVPPGGEVTFAPGGRHAMLFGVPASVQPGGTLELTLRFADGQAVRVPAKVVGAGEAAPE